MSRASHAPLGVFNGILQQLVYFFVRRRSVCVIWGEKDAWCASWFAQSTLVHRPFNFLNLKSCRPVKRFTSQHHGLIFNAGRAKPNPFRERIVLHHVENTAVRVGAVKNDLSGAVSVKDGAHEVFTLSVPLASKLFFLLFWVAHGKNNGRFREHVRDSVQGTHDDNFLAGG